MIRKAYRSKYRIPSVRDRTYNRRHRKSRWRWRARTYTHTHRNTILSSRLFTLPAGRRPCSRRLVALSPSTVDSPCRTSPTYLSWLSLHLFTFVKSRISISYDWFKKGLSGIKFFLGLFRSDRYLLWIVFLDATLTARCKLLARARISLREIREAILTLRHSTAVWRFCLPKLCLNADRARTHAGRVYF